MPTNTIVKGYQWYYLEAETTREGAGTPKKTPISGATTMSFTLLAEAASKTVMVEATSTEGTVYKSNPLNIGSLSLAITKPTLDGYSTSKFVAPGETVKVGGAIVTDTGGAKLQSSQITYSYQWFYQVGESFTVIDGAKSGTYTIPADAIEKGISNIRVAVTAKVGASVVESGISDNMLTVSKEPSNTLISAIEALRISDTKYNVTKFEEFKAAVTAVDSKYEALSAPAKANVTNYAVLKRALADIEAISALDEKVKKVDVSDQDLPKHLKDIEEVYDKLDVLQRSLDVGGALYNTIRAMLKDPTDIEEITKVRELSQAIVNLLNYDNNVIKYVPTSVELLQEAVEAIEADIAKLSKSY